MCTCVDDTDKHDDDGVEVDVLFNYSSICRDDGDGSDNDDGDDDGDNKNETDDHNGVDDGEDDNDVISIVQDED